MVWVFVQKAADDLRLKYILVWSFSIFKRSPLTDDRPEEEEEGYEHEDGSFVIFR